MINLKRTSVASVVAAMIVLLASPLVFGQNRNQDPAKDPEQEKKLTEAIDKLVEKYEMTLKLEDWQTFYADSILNHDYRAMQEEIMNLSSAKVSNSDLYLNVQDKWNEKIYDAFKAILTEDQFTKFLKMGAGREKKAREKRRQNEGK